MRTIILYVWCNSDIKRYKSNISIKVRVNKLKTFIYALQINNFHNAT